MTKISAVIITKNEERNIERCLKSLQGVADEIIVVDSFSTDRTKEICVAFGAQFIQHIFEGHIEQKNWALEQAKYAHILSLDADEELSERLRESILKVKENWTCDGYCFNRLTNYCGNWIRHGSWYPDVKIRLWERKKGKWGGINPHDCLIMTENATVKHLKGDLLHYSYYSINQHISQINTFTDIGAAEAYKKGKKSPSLFMILLRAKWKFVSDYILKLGFLDGYAGFLVCKYSSLATFSKYVKLRQLHANQKESAKNA